MTLNPEQVEKVIEAMEKRRVLDCQLEDILRNENYGVECDEYNDTNIHAIVQDLQDARSALAILTPPESVETEESADVKQAFAMLAMHGVSRERAVTISNGIEVLATRHQRGLAAAREQGAREAGKIGMDQGAAWAIASLIRTNGHCNHQTGTMIREWGFRSVEDLKHVEEYDAELLRAAIMGDSGKAEK